MNKFWLPAVAAVLSAAVSCVNGPSGEFQFDLLTTNDVHGSWFDSTYVGGQVKNSLMAINTYVNEYRDSLGKDNVLLVDAGDCLQGDNAAYYFNYVDTLSPHLFSRLAAYMKYDAVCVGNHDVETGHPVYDRVAKELKASGIPFLAGNAVRPDGSTWFDGAKILKRHGVKIAVLGYTNANIRAWLDESLWKGMEFKSLIPLVQEDVDRVRAKERPQVVIVAVHSGTGLGDGTIYESQGKDLLRTLRGVDFLVCSHDHSALAIQQDSICLINSGSHARNIGHGRINLTLKDGKVVSKTVGADIIKVNAARVDTAMEAKFHTDFEKVKAFTLREVGSLDTDLLSRDSYAGMCPYMNLIHTLTISPDVAQISFAAPLAFNKEIKAGKLVYNDLFTIYPYENQLVVIRMKGDEILRYLEYSYDNWIQTYTPGGHVLKIEEGEDQRTFQTGWHFVNRSYNFDSAAGLVYTVDVTKPYGERVKITSLAGGGQFCADSTYNVSMTSYRAAGGGNLLSKGAGIDTGNMDDRIVARLDDIRNILYDYVQHVGTIKASELSNSAILGDWEFIPSQAIPALRADMKLLFGK